MILALVMCLFAQDSPIDECVKGLLHADPAVRRDSEERLRKSSFDDLPQLEKHLRHPEAKVRTVIGSAMHDAIAAQLGKRTARFELRPVAALDVMSEWIDAGADPKKPPKDHEAVRNPGKVGGGVYDRDWILLQSIIVTEKDVEKAEAQPSFEMAKEGVHWQVGFELKEDGARTFDAAAAELFSRKPRGLLAIMVDGRILTAPQIQSERFDGKGQITGGFTEIEARKIAKVLKGDWLTSSVRLDPARKDAKPLDGVMDLIRHYPGLSETTLHKSDARLEISGLVDLKQFKLVEFWQTLRESGYRILPKK